MKKPANGSRNFGPVLSYDIETLCQERTDDEIERRLALNCCVWCFDKPEARAKEKERSFARASGLSQRLTLDSKSQNPPPRQNRKKISRFFALAIAIPTNSDTIVDIEIEYQLEIASPPPWAEFQPTPVCNASPVFVLGQLPQHTNASWRPDMPTKSEKISLTQGLFFTATLVLVLGVLWILHWAFSFACRATLLRPDNGVRSSLVSSQLPGKSR